jgi:hypothetical protein
LDPAPVCELFTAPRRLLRMISHVEPGGARSLNYFREDGTLRDWAELTDDEKERVIHRVALRFLDSPRLQHHTAARLRENGSPFFDRIADAMDAETAARAARSSLGVARAADE